MPFALGFPKDECAGLSEGECNSPPQIFAKMNGIATNPLPFFFLGTHMTTSSANPELDIDRTARVADARRLVVKVGSNVLTWEGGLNLEVVAALGRQICTLMDAGREVILVSSGAMAAGLKKMNFAARPDTIPERQAVSAVGQAGLILEYELAFGRYGRRVAQVLLTGDGLHSRKRYLNARNTLNQLLEWGVAPIINENDTVSVEEIKFGDNDNLSAMIALMAGADLLINLTDIDGLYDRDPRSHSEARLIPLVTTIGREVENCASGIVGSLGTGGMLTKIKAARKVNTAGIPMIIAGGRVPDVLRRLLEGEKLGTFFAPKKERMANRKSWIGFSVRPRGGLRIDPGAVRALVERGKSLLPIGITAVEGDFRVGAPVEILNPDGEVVGVGLVNYGAADIRKIQGLRSDGIREKLGDRPYDEVVHRDNLTIVLPVPV